MSFKRSENIYFILKNIYFNNLNKNLHVNHIFKMAEIDKEKIDFFCNHFFKILLNTIKLTQYFKFWFYFEEQTFSFIIKRKDITKICSKYAKMLKYWNIVKIGLIVKLGPLTLSTRQIKIRKSCLSYHTRTIESPTFWMLNF